MDSRLHAVSWNLTQRCNLHCDHCYLDSTARASEHDSEMTKDECLDVVDQLSSLNPQLFLILTGGEPLLHPRLTEIVERAASSGMTVVLGTNGTLVTKQLAGELVEAGLSGAGVSIDSADESLHDRLRGVPGAWQRAIDGIEVMKAANLEVLIQTSIFFWNRQELARLAELARDLGAAALNLYFLVCTGRGQGLTDLSPVQYEATLEEIYRLQESMRGELLIGVKCAPHYKRVVHQHDPDSPFLASYQGGCPAATHYCRIDPSGEATPCPYMPPAGDSLRAQPLSEIWEHSPRFTELRERSALGGRCGACNFRDLCGGCRARALAVSGQAMAEDPSCDYRPDSADSTDEPEEPVRVAADKTFGLEEECSLQWTEEARERLRAVPSFLRGMVGRRLEVAAKERGLNCVTAELMKEVRQSSLASQQAGAPLGRIVSGKADPPVTSSDDDIVWSEEARRRVEDAPEFVRPGILKLMEIRARERGHSTISSGFLSEIRNESMMRVAKVIRRFGFEELKEEAFSEAKDRMRRNADKVEVIGQIEAFLAARTTKNTEIIDKFRRYLGVAAKTGLPWTPEASQWLRNAPAPAEKLEKRIEQRAREVRAPVVSLELIHDLGIESAKPPSATTDGRPVVGCKGE